MLFLWNNEDIVRTTQFWQLDNQQTSGWGPQTFQIPKLIFHFSYLTLAREHQCSPPWWDVYCVIIKQQKDVETLKGHFNTIAGESRELNNPCLFLPLFLFSLTSNRQLRQLQVIVVVHLTLTIVWHKIEVLQKFWGNAVCTMWPHCHLLDYDISVTLSVYIVCVTLLI